MNRSLLCITLLIASFLGLNIGANCQVLPYIPLYKGTTNLDNIGLYAVQYQYFDGRSGSMPPGWTGIFTADTGIACMPFGIQNGKSAFFLGPIWRGGGTGDTSQVFFLKMPKAHHIRLTFSVAMRTGFVGPKLSDGAIFRVFANNKLLEEYDQTTAEWKQFVLDLSPFAGKRLQLKFQTDPGPRRDPSFDYSFWGNRRIYCDAGPIPGRNVAWPHVHGAFTPHPTYGDAAPLAYGSGVPKLRAVWQHNGTRFLSWLKVRLGHSTVVPVLSPSAGASVDLVMPNGTVVSSNDSSVQTTALQLPPPKGTHALTMLQYTYKIKGSIFHLTAEIYQPKGDCVKVRVTSSSHHIAAVHFGRIAMDLRGTELPPDYRKSVTVPYYGSVTYLPQYRLFTNLCIDYSLSHASELNPSSAIYGALTTGARNAVDETVYYAVSPQLADVLPTPPNPPSPYRGVMSALTVMDIWGNTFDQNRQLIQELASYGLTNLFTIIHNWQHGGYDNQLPDVMPPASILGGLPAMKALVDTAEKLGERIGLHENYVDYYPNAPSYNRANVALGSDGKPVLAWKNLIQSYALAMQHTLPIAEHYDSEIEAQLHTNATFEDVCSAVPPWFHVDFNANTAGAGKFHTVISTFTKLWAMYRRHHDGPVLGEGNNHWYWSGLLDGAEAQFGTGWPQADGETAPLAVNFDLLKIHPLELNHGMGYLERWAPQGYAAGWQTRTMTPQVMDRYRAQEIAYGHSAFVPSQLVGNLAYVWQEANLVPPVVRRTAQSPVTRILYRHDHKWLTFEQMTALGAFCRRVMIRYKSGVTVKVNGSSNPWRTSAGSKPVELPSSGWVAYGDGLVASTASYAGITADYAQTARRIYVNARANYNLGPKVFRLRPSISQWSSIGPRQFKMQFKWQVDEKVPSGTQVFVHLIAASNNHAAKTDPTGIVEVLNSGLLTSPDHWSAGTVRSLPVEVTLPQSVPAGDYHIRVGIWFPAGGRRLLLLGNSDDGRRVLVGNLQVLPDGSVTFNKRGTRSTSLVDNVTDTNQDGKVIDFGPVRTNGSILALKQANGNWIIHPFPRTRPFKVGILPAALGIKAGHVRLLGMGAKGQIVENLSTTRQGPWRIFGFNTNSSVRYYELQSVK